MRDRLRNFDSKITFFAFADIITAVSGMLIFITLLLATDLGRPSDSRSQAANAGLQRQLQQIVAQQAKADAENASLQRLLTTANTAPAPDKLQSDIARLRAELADEKSKHAGLAGELAASQSTLAERDQLLGITAVREQVQSTAEQLDAMAREDAKIRDATDALEEKMRDVNSKIAKLRSREGQLWIIPERSTTSKEPVLAVVSGKELRIERFNRPDQSQRFDKSDAKSGFQSFLKSIKPGNQYVVFLIRPSGIALFKEVEQVARKAGFEVGYDALEEDREIHFTSPPPIDDEAVPGRPEGPEAAQGRTGEPAGARGTTGPSGARGSSGSAGGRDSAAGAAGTGGTNAIEEAGATNASTGSGTNSMSSTNVVSSHTNAISPATNAVSSVTNTAPPNPPPPPKPKSWWQRFLEWLGIG
jgi:hypothetical protein